MATQETRVLDTVEGIKAALQGISPKPFSRAAAADYARSFAESGSRKGDVILTEIGKYSLPLRHIAFVSIGGSTGTETLRVLQRSEIDLAILLENDNSAVDVARTRFTTMEAQGKKLVTICGDATQKLPEVKGQLLDWKKERALQGVIVSAQAVLHELPMRSPGFDLDHFLGELFWDWPICLFFCRETCPPLNWPSFVRLRCKGFDSELMETLARHIQRYLTIPGDVQRHGHQFVRMPRSLAIEVLTKVFYWPEFPHEIQEKVTSFSIDQLVETVRYYLGPNSVSQRELTSNSFDRFYRLFEVEARDDDNRSLESPRCFIQITGERVGSIAGIEPPDRRPRLPAQSLERQIKLLRIGDDIRNSIEVLLTHLQYPEFMSVGGQISRNPIWNNAEVDELSRFRETYRVDGPTPPQVIHLDMFLIRKNDNRGKAQLYTYFSHDWDADLIPFRLRGSRESAKNRSQLNSANIAKFFEVAPEAATIRPLAGRFAVSLKPHAKYKDLVLYIFEFCSAELRLGSALPNQRDSVSSDSRWRTLRSLRDDVQLDRVNGDVTRAIRELFGHDLNSLPESM